AAQSPESIAEAVLYRIAPLLPYVRATVALFDWEAQKIDLMVSYNRNNLEIMEKRVAIDDFLLQQIRELQLGKVCYLDDLSYLDATIPWITKLRTQGIRSGMLVPLLAHGELIGSLNLWAKVVAAFDAGHIEVAHEVADSLAVAMKQASLHQQVVEANQRLQSISRRLVEVQEAERRNLARELHDEIGQDLTALKLASEISAREPAQAKPALGQAQSIVNQLMARVRELSLNLRPAMLDDLGLLPALLWHFKRYTAQTHIEVELKHADIDKRFEPEIETAAYRIVQEGLTNIARHAETAKAIVRLWSTAETLCVQVQDDGKGFSPQEVLADDTRFGLRGMSERTLLLQGSLVVDSVPGGGTCVTAELPLKATLIPQAI
ncbi:MAG: GAF domain-containing sensor histidine kinase, partial [Abitibacteriaceae bacterium]|nr:GAF domain-containing sensor histidine kinase [Abditibacteriaceae bacterium]